jgi:hypothetical protein
MQAIPDEFEAWSGLDDEFYKLNTDEMVARYVRANSAQFDCPTQGL